MFSSLLRSKRSRSTIPPPRQSYFDRDPSTRTRQGRSRYDSADSNSDGDDDEQVERSGEDDTDEQASAEDGDDGLNEATPLLPIFSAAHLDALPVYNLTHSLRLLIIQRCETTLSWEQLRSPQISQFLVKPIQQQIRKAQLSRATLYALLANCLQFTKEAQENPGNVGVCRTRALVAELLAMRLLREFTIRELIDALSYDFDPLQGVTAPPSKSSGLRDPAARGSAVRTSTLEVAIRAQAKRFLAHPLCVQHLEAIWAGSIVFHSAADSLHRYPSKPSLNNNRHYGATHASDDTGSQSLPLSKLSRSPLETARRSVTLYNPKEASLFKLSRLRVPKYRNIFSTISYAVLLGLFLAVLIERSRDITSLEIVFWFWSAGFMLDEIVGFSEQGFNLYIMSVWNIFDIGILVLFVVFYVLRFYGIFISMDEKHHVTNLSYDILASTAVLLFPRLFSLLDHYRYFSQLLIAFRMMSQDLVAIMVLITISCSGFFVAFTLSFGNDENDASAVAFALFQILMGFTPAAWEVWPTYNLLGKGILALFLVICHFLVVTILISVLTNSFTAIVKNANEEHQFLFAVNVLSMVKSDALFSYIAPSNIFGWLISPLRFIMPFRHYVRLNRTIIKVTHFPVLFIIFAYERMRLGRYAVEPTELVEVRGRQRGRLPTFALQQEPRIFTPQIRFREPSITTRYKDRALEEVFRRPFRGDSTARKSSVTPSQKVNVVDSWISNIGDVASPPAEDSRTVLDQLEVRRRPLLGRSNTSGTRSRRIHSPSQSLFSDPGNRATRRRPQVIPEHNDLASPEPGLSLQPTEADGDDELRSSEDDEPDTSLAHGKSSLEASARPGLNTPPTRVSTPNPFASSPQTPRQYSRHNRHASVNTIVYNPEPSRARSSSSNERNTSAQPSGTPQTSRRPSLLTSTLRSTTNTPPPSTPPNPNTKAPRPFRPQPTARTTTATRIRPILPPRNDNHSTPNLARFLDLAHRHENRKPSFDTLALDLASDIGDNRPFNALPVSGSYGTSADFGAAVRRRERVRDKEKVEESNMMSRIVLARMNTLEEGFKDILKEVKEWRMSSSRGGSDAGGPGGSGAGSSGVGVAARRAQRRVEKGRRLEGDAGSVGVGAEESGGLIVPGERVGTGVGSPALRPSGLRFEEERMNKG